MQLQNYNDLFLKAHKIILKVQKQEKTENITK